MKLTLLAACLLLRIALTGAEDVGENSIPEPTQFSVVVSHAGDDAIVVHGPIRIESDDTKATLTVIEVATFGGKRLRGVRLLLRNASQDDNLYLDANQVAQLRDEFAGLEHWFERNETCGAGKRCVHGVARCRPSQTVRQAFCPGFYSTPDGERGVLLSTPRYLFRFPSMEPSMFVKALDAAIGELN